MDLTTSWRSLILSCMPLHLRSRNLYFNLRSSLALFSSSIMKGRVAHWLRIWISSALISISPVAMSPLIMESGLLLTFPFTAIQYSSLSSWAFFWSSGDASSSTTTWVWPYLSRRLMKWMAPWFLSLWTHPLRMTVFPSSLALRAPQVTVLCMKASSIKVSPWSKEILSLIACYGYKRRTQLPVERKLLQAWSAMEEKI